MNDYAGDGKQDLVIEVHAGDSTTAIGETLHKQDVVKTVKAFLEAAESNQAITAIQPGYYRLRTEIPADLGGEAARRSAAAGWASW